MQQMEAQALVHEKSLERLIAASGWSGKAGKHLDKILKDMGRAAEYKE